MKRLLIAAALALAPATVFAADFSGAWTIHGDVGGAIQTTVQPGDRLTIETPGGGGYGQ